MSVVLCMKALLFAHLMLAQADGYAITPDGQTYQWDQSGGATYGPDGSGSWDNGSGYSVSPDGGYSTWSGPIEPVIPANPIPFQPEE